MIKIIQKYIGTSFVLPFVLSVVFFVSFLLTFQLFKVTKLVINKGIPLSSVIELLSYISISFLPMAIPLSSLFAVIYTMNKISGDSEFMAIRSFGLSKSKVLAPLMILSLFISMAVFSLNQKLIPLSNREFKKALITLTSSGYLADIQAEKFFTDLPGVTLLAEKVENDGKYLTNVFIESAPVDGRESSVIMAKNGELIKDEINKWGLSSFRLKLFDGNALKTYANGEFEKIFFQTYDFPISEGRITAVLITKDSMRTSSELYQIMKMSSEELESNGHNIHSTKLEYYGRINTAIICIVFVFLGFSLGVKNTRGANRNTGLITLVILLLYYGLYFAGLSVARNGKIPAELAIFAPTFLTYLCSWFYYRKLEWID